MYLRAVITVLLLGSSTILAQQTPANRTPAPPDVQEPVTHDAPPPPPALTLRPRDTAPDASPTDLPDAPSAAMTQQESVVVINKTAQIARGEENKPCTFVSSLGMIYFDFTKDDARRPRCSELIYPYQRFLNSNVAIPLNWKQKGYLAAHFTTDPTAIGTIVGISALSVALDSHSAYGPGMKGFGKLAGVSLLQNATAEFFGTFAVPSIMHQDPRYYRMPQKPFGKRLLYAVSRSYISRADDGHTIPNYGTLSAYPIVAELSNLYVPGVQTDGASTTERILTGLALDPVNNVVNEFLPDVARHIHIRIIFVQQILNNIAYSNNGMM